MSILTQIAALLKGHCEGKRQVAVCYSPGVGVCDACVDGGHAVGHVGRLYFADRPRGRGPIQKDRDACLLASFGCSSENGSDSWKGEGRGSPNPKGCFLPLI